MIQHPLRKTWYYKRFGITGLRWFAFIWFPIILAMLSVIVGAFICLWVVYPSAVGNLTAMVTFSAGALGVLLLLKIYRGFRMEMRQFEAELRHDLPCD